MENVIAVVLVVAVLAFAVYKAKAKRITGTGEGLPKENTLPRPKDQA